MEDALEGQEDRSDIKRAEQAASWKGFQPSMRSTFCKEIMTSPYHFDLNASGRCGTISCSKDNLNLEMDWEMSGVPDKDILLAPIDLTRWASGEGVPEAEQRMILHHLRDWLVAKKTSADIERPTEEIDHSAKCVWSGCAEHPLKSFAYCASHYDDTLLKK